MLGAQKNASLSAGKLELLLYAVFFHNVSGIVYRIARTIGAIRLIRGQPKSRIDFILLPIQTIEIGLQIEGRTGLRLKIAKTLLPQLNLILVISQTFTHAF